MPIVIPGDTIPPDEPGGGPPLVVTDDLYDLWLGPLGFTWPSDVVEETLGNTLEAVGAALTPSERRPKPLKVPLRIEGHPTGELDARAIGNRIRRNVRQLLENPAWLAHGLYLWWRADRDLAGWVMLGGGTVRESDPGVSFGIWELELESLYLVGRPATHRPGRRLDLADRRTGLVPRDTRGTIYSTDYADAELPDEPLITPGDVVGATSSANQDVGTMTQGPVTDERTLWRSTAAIDGEVVSYQHDDELLPDARDAYVVLDDPGSVRIWDLTDAEVYPPDADAYTSAGDLAPDDVYGWEPVYGPAIRDAGAPLAIDNGAVRLVWLGAHGTRGLALEWFDDDLGTYRRQGRVLHALDVREVAIVEATPERSVIEWRAGPRTMRAILQRGWTHARLESYNDTGGTARLEYASEPADGAITVGADGTLAWVVTLTAGTHVVRWARGTDDDVVLAPSSAIITPAAPATSVQVHRARSLVAQVGTPLATAATVASWSLVDARSTPVLLARCA